MKYKKFSSITGLLALIAGIILGFGTAYTLKINVDRPAASADLALNQHYIEDIRSDTVDLDDPLAVFNYVYARLPENVNVYPTENYYYFRFFANSQEIWGNVRLDAADREKGVLSFGYFGAHNLPEKREDLDYTGNALQLGSAQGVLVTKQNPLRYAVTYGGKKIVFSLNNLPQTPPPDFKLRDEEKFMARTFDESGFQLVLLFDQAKQQFRFILDETAPVPDVLYELEEKLHLGRRSGFAFYHDELRRKVLMAVDANNVRRNNYYDGPFDQLADNFVEGEELQQAMEDAYPYVRGRTNERGVFLDSEGNALSSRLALTPYLTYNSLNDLRQFVSRCQKQDTENDLLACLTYDYKQDVPAAAEQ